MQVTDAAQVYYPYWDRIIYGLFVGRLIVSVELLAIIWLLMLILEAMRKT